MCRGESATLACNEAVSAELDHLPTCVDARRLDKPAHAQC